MLCRRLSGYTIASLGFLVDKVEIFSVRLIIGLIKRIRPIQQEFLGLLVLHRMY